MDIFRERVYLRGEGRVAHHRARAVAGGDGRRRAAARSSWHLPPADRADRAPGSPGADRALAPGTARSGPRSDRRPHGPAAAAGAACPARRAGTAPTETPVEATAPDGSAPSPRKRRRRRRRRRWRRRCRGEHEPQRTSELSDRVLPHHRHRLRQRRPAPRPRVREGRRRLPSPAIAGCAATTSGSSSAWTSTARRWRRPRPADGVTPQALRRSRSPRSFEATWDRLAISHDQFIRTTDAGAPGRRAGADRADLRAQSRRFLREVLLGAGTASAARRSSSDVGDRGREVRAAPDARRCEWVAERNWFFRLSRYQRLPAARCIEANPDFIRPESRRERDPRPPRPGAGGHLGQPRAARAGACPFRGPPATASSRRRTSGSTRCPTTWTATRLPGRGCASVAGAAARHRQGHHPLPLRDLAGDARGGRGSRCRSASGRTASCSSAASASARAPACKLDLDEAIDRFGPDAFRYFLLREIPWDGDGNFSWERFEERYISDLADGLGNLASRSLAMIEKYREGVVPRNAPATPLDAKQAQRAVAAYAAAMDALDLRARRRSHAGSLVAAANLFIVQTAPWALAKRATTASWISSSPRWPAASHGWRCCPARSCPGRRRRCGRRWDKPDALRMRDGTRRSGRHSAEPRCANPKGSFRSRFRPDATPIR